MDEYSSVPNHLAPNAAAKAPKQFWIDIRSAFVPILYNGVVCNDKIAHGSLSKHPDNIGVDSEGYVHVIEASYAKELEAEVERLKRLLEASEEDYSRYIRCSTEKLAVAEAAILLMKKHNDNLHKKGNVPWGQTFGIDFGLMNEALIAQDKALASIRGKNG